MTDKCWVCINCEIWTQENIECIDAPNCTHCGAKMIMGMMDPETGIPVGMTLSPSIKAAWYARHWPNWVRAIAWALLDFVLSIIWYYLISAIIYAIFAVSLLQMLLKIAGR